MSNKDARGYTSMRLAGDVQSKVAPEERYIAISALSIRTRAKEKNILYCVVINKK